MRLKEIMIEKHVSGAKLARDLGVSAAYINAAVSGKTNLSVKKCEEIAKVLDVPVAALFEGYTKPGTLYCPHCGKPFRLVGD